LTNEIKAELTERDKEYLRVANEGGNLFVRKLLIAHAAGLLICVNIIASSEQSNQIQHVAAQTFVFFLIGLGMSMMSAVVGHANALFRALYPTKAFLNTILQRAVYYGLDALTGVCLSISGLLFFIALITAYDFIK
jgi:hypothetical protein